MSQTVEYRKTVEKVSIYIDNCFMGYISKEYDGSIRVFFLDYEVKRVANGQISLNRAVKLLMDGKQ